MNENYFLIGYSGHSYVVLDSCLKNGILINGYFDLKENQNNPYNLVFLGSENDFPFSNDDEIILGIGNNSIRHQIYSNLKKQNCRFKSIIDSSSIISDRVTIEGATYVGPGAIINSQSIIGECVIINSGSIVEHECQIDSFSHIAPGATLCGNVKVGMSSLIGANSTVLPGVEIGSNCIIGAGSIITKNIDDNTIVYDNKVFKKK